MKKTTTLLVLIIVCISSLSAGSLPYSLEDDFTIDTLIFTNYELELEDDMITITPPAKYMERRDKIVESAAFPDVEEFDGWMALAVKIKDNVSYKETYEYIANELGEGTSENNTRFYIDRYKKEPSEEAVVGMLFSGKLGDYLAKALPAILVDSLYSENDGEFSHINMWVTDEITVFTLEHETGNAIVYVHSGIIGEFLDSLLTTLFAEGLGNL